MTFLGCGCVISLILAEAHSVIIASQATKIQVFWQSTISLLLNFVVRTIFWLIEPIGLNCIYRINEKLTFVLFLLKRCLCLLWNINIRVFAWIMDKHREFYCFILGNAAKKKKLVDPRPAVPAILSSHNYNGDSLRLPSVYRRNMRTSVQSFTSRRETVCWFHVCAWANAGSSFTLLHVIVVLTDLTLFVFVMTFNFIYANAERAIK